MMMVGSLLNASLRLGGVGDDDGIWSSVPNPSRPFGLAFLAGIPGDGVRCVKRVGLLLSAGGTGHCEQLWRVLTHPDRLAKTWPTALEPIPNVLRTRVSFRGDYLAPWGNFTQRAAQSNARKGKRRQVN